MPGLTTLLPATVAVAQWRGDPPAGGSAPHDLALYPGEESAVARVVPKRRQEFAVARSCARQALEQLGVPPVAIPKGPAGEPQWPTGIVGSITHCEGYAAAALAHRERMLTLGIDAEPNQPLPEGVLGLTASSSEIARLDRLAAGCPQVQWGRLLFCAKEAVYKAWFPVRRRWLGFEDVDVRIEPDGRFVSRLSKPAPDAGRFAELHGRWAVDGDVLLAALVLFAC